jgi:hypothetical protein
MSSSKKTLKPNMLSASQKVFKTEELDEKENWNLNMKGEEELSDIMVQDEPSDKDFKLEDIIPLSTIIEDPRDPSMS